jgi:hypothetical protein
VVGERAVQGKINLILTDLIGNNLIYYFEKPDRELRKGLFLNRQSEKLKAVWKKRVCPAAKPLWIFLHLFT